MRIDAETLQMRIAKLRQLIAELVFDQTMYAKEVPLLQKMMEKIID